MPRTPLNLHGFLQHLRRRLFLIRLFEATGIGTLCGGAFALVLALALLWQARDAMALCAAALCMGALAGALAGVIRRPTLFDAAGEADRQLELSDLLMTALTARDPSDPWQATVRALADARCGALQPSAVIVHRLGGRAWGGIGLSAALVLTLGALSLPAATPAARATSDTLSPAQAAMPQRERLREQMMSAPSPTMKQAARGEMSETHPLSDNAVRNAPAHSPEALSGSAPGAGTREGATDATPGTDNFEPAGESVSRTGDAPPAGGGRSGGARQGADATVAGLFATPQAERHRVAPWHSEAWRVDRAAAERATREGRVPDRTRDVVAEYFRSD